MRRAVSILSVDRIPMDQIPMDQIPVDQIPVEGVPAQWVSACLVCALLLGADAVRSQDAGSFRAGPVIADFGRIAEVDSDVPIPEGAEFRVAFDISAGEAGAFNRDLDRVARFLNLHVASGVALDRLHPAVVVHSTAAFDVVSDERYARRSGRSNPNSELVAALVDAGVELYLCGQSAAARGIAKSDLLPGVQLADSAMTVHALLQQRGYTLNPF